MDEFDKILENMNNEFQVQSSSNPSARGFCSKCRKDITGVMMQAMGKTYHEHCFICERCGKRLEDYVESNGKAYCYDCCGAPICGYCNKMILTGELIEALGKKYHNEHWKCTRCQKFLGTGQFYIRENLQYCESCARNSK